MRILAIMFFLAVAASPALAEELATPESTVPVVSDADPHPILSSDAGWAGAAIIIILGTFLAATVVGPIVRLEVPDAVPQAFSHHEDPSHHSGNEDDRPGAGVVDQ